MKNRRRYTRWQINQQAKLKLAGAERFAPCLVKDINFSGAQISLRMKLPEDNFLKLSLVLSDEFILDIEAWVVWHKHSSDTMNTYALYFNKIKEEDKEKIYRFVYNCFPQELAKTGKQELTMKKGDEAMQDRRIFARFPMKLPLRFIEGEAAQECTAETCDVSAKGIGLVTQQAFRPGVPLEMWLQMPDRNEPLYTRGEVVWSQMLEPNKYRTGIELEKAELMAMSRVFRA